MSSRRRSRTRTVVLGSFVFLVLIVGAGRIYADKPKGENSPQVTLKLTITDADSGFKLSAEKRFKKDIIGLEALQTLVPLTYDKYPQLGVLITSLCEVAPERGKAWMLDINGESSKVGINSVVLSADTTMDWNIK